MPATYNVRVTAIQEETERHVVYGRPLQQTVAIRMEGDGLDLTVSVPADDQPRVGTRCTVTITPTPEAP